MIRVPGPEHGCALALETVDGGRRYRLEIAKADLVSVLVKEAPIEVSREAEQRWECKGCGRRFGCQAHYDQHVGAPCGQSKNKKKKPAAPPPPAGAGGDGDDAGNYAPPKRAPPLRRRPKVGTARVELKPDAEVAWRVEVAAALTPLLRADSFLGADAAWAPCGP